MQASSKSIVTAVGVGGEDSEADYESKKIATYYCRVSSANFMTVSSIILSGKEDTRAEWMNH
jgi:hypothetical protein